MHGGGLRLALKVGVAVTALTVNLAVNGSWQGIAVAFADESTVGASDAGAVEASVSAAMLDAATPPPPSINTPSTYMNCPSGVSSDVVSITGVSNVPGRRISGSFQVEIVNANGSRTLYHQYDFDQTTDLQQKIEYPPVSQWTNGEIHVDVHVTVRDNGTTTYELGGGTDWDVYCNATPPTATSTATATSTSTSTPTLTPTPTSTSTPTETPTSPPGSTSTPTSTTPTSTSTPTQTPSSSPPGSSSTSTPTPTPTTGSPSSPATATLTPTTTTSGGGGGGGGGGGVTGAASTSRRATATSTPTSPAPATATPRSTNTPTPTLVPTLVAAAVATPTSTAVPTDTPTPTAVPTEVAAEVATPAPPMPRPTVLPATGGPDVDLALVVFGVIASLGLVTLRVATRR